MSKKKMYSKKDENDRTLKTIILITAILNLLDKLLDVIRDILNH